jgi:hypothetical protein
VGTNAGVVWRLDRYEQGALPGLSVGDIVAIDYTDKDYIVSKPGGGRVATLPVSSWKLEKCVCCTELSGGSLRYRASQDTPYATLSNRAERIKVTFNPAA